MTDPKREADELRQELARIDAQLLGALESRARLARRIGELRKGQGQPGAALVERSTLDDVLARASGEMPVESLREIFREVYASCLALELPVTIAFVGPEGAFGHAAARLRFGASAKLVACDTIHGALDEVTKERAVFAVVPYETRVEGPVLSTIAAITASDLKIVSSFQAASNLHLMARPGHPTEFEKIFTTPSDHANCDRFLAAQPARLAVIDVKSATVACQLALDEAGTAAIATEVFGASQGLEIAKKNVQGNGDDTRVRYAIVGARPSGRSGTDLTAVAFAVDDQPGSLLTVLRQFGERGVNMTKIHSRPTPGGEAWSYVFYVEVAGHATERQLVTAFEEAKRSTKFFKVLGSYPAQQ
jgi:chorismate mutase/prephenate dehydratase